MKILRRFLILFFFIICACIGKKETVQENTKIDNNGLEKTNEYSVLIEENINNNSIIQKKRSSTEGMNKIDATSIFFLINNGNTEGLQLTGSEGSYSFKFGLSNIRIDYWSKMVEFDADYEHYHWYYPDDYIEMEENIENGTNNFFVPFGDNIRRNEKNGIIYVDAFRFSQFEPEDIRLQRLIFITSNNYNIQITFNGDRNLKDNIIEETPNYFRIRTHSTLGGDMEYNSETKEAGLVIWNFHIEATDIFGNDLLNGTHKSKTANDWFLETEALLNKIGMR